MADKLTIHIGVDGSNNTVSKFVAPEKGKLSFHNDSSSPAEIKFEGSSPVCAGNDPQPIFIIEGKTQKDFQVCKNTSGQSFKYTATVTGSEPEDPILFVERAPILWVEMVGPVLVGLVAGVVAGYLIAMRRRTRSQ